MVVEDAHRQYAGHPKDLAGALEEIDDVVNGSADGAVVDLRSPDRDAAWAALGS